MLCKCCESHLHQDEGDDDDEGHKICCRQWLYAVCAILINRPQQSYYITPSVSSAGLKKREAGRPKIPKILWKLFREEGHTEDGVHGEDLVGNHVLVREHILESEHILVRRSCREQCTWRGPCRWVRWHWSWREGTCTAPWRLCAAAPAARVAWEIERR